MTLTHRCWILPYYFHYNQIHSMNPEKKKKTYKKCLTNLSYYLLCIIIQFTFICAVYILYSNSMVKTRLDNKVIIEYFRFIPLLFHFIVIRRREESKREKWNNIKMSCLSINATIVIVDETQVESVSLSLCLSLTLSFALALSLSPSSYQTNEIDGFVCHLPTQKYFSLSFLCIYLFDFVSLWSYKLLWTSFKLNIIWSHYNGTLFSYIFFFGDIYARTLWEWKKNKI